MDEIKYCAWCGTELMKDNSGTRHCPNCGVQNINQDVLESKDKNEKGGCPSYVN